MHVLPVQPAVQRWRGIRTVHGVGSVHDSAVEAAQRCDLRWSGPWLGLHSAWSGVAQVLAVYRAMTEAEAEAYRTGTDKDTGLERYATLDALGQTRLDLARMKEAGTVVRGEIGHDPEVTSLDLEAKTPTANRVDERVVSLAGVAFSPVSR